MDSCIDCKYFRTDCEFSKTASALESVQCGQFESSDKVCNLKRRTT